jgi:hypothetical protein
MWDKPGIPPCFYSGEASLEFLPTPTRQRRIVPSVYGHQFCSGGYNLPTSGTVLLSSWGQVMCPTHLAGLYIHLDGIWSGLVRCG